MKRCGIIAILAGLMIAFTGNGYAQNWEVAYGSAKGHVAVFNSKTNPKFAEDAPYGPMAFRVVAGQLWLLDSIGGKLLTLNDKGELKNELIIKGLPDNVLLEDFALVTGNSDKVETFWVADAADCTIRKISVGSGKELLKIGGNGREAGKFLQINQLEVDRGGRLYVGDYGRSVIAIFTQYGELIREIPWQNNGFAIDAKGRLHVIVYRENSGHFHRLYSQQGQLVQSNHLGLNTLRNPKLWEILKNGNIAISFIPAEGFKGHLKFYEIAESAQILNRTELVPCATMNRFVSCSDNRLWIAEASFYTAPDGKFMVKSFAWDGKK